MRTVVFINGHSRQASQYIKTVRKYFAKPKNPFEVLDFIVVDTLSDFDTAIKKLAAHKKIECVIVGSGDGTIVSVFNALKNRRNLVYGFIPLGTSNNYIRSLGVPHDVRKALRTLSKLYTRKVSLGTVNGAVFANNAGIGIPVQVVDNLTNKTKRYLGPIAYLVSGIRELFRHDPIWCELEIDGKIQEFYTHQLSVSSGAFKGTAIPLQRVTSVFSDELTLVYSATKERAEYAKDVFGFVYGRPVKRQSLHIIPIKEAKLRTRPAKTIQADGEIIGKTPAQISIIKDAIQVITKPPKQARKRRSTKRTSRRQHK